MKVLGLDIGTTTVSAVILENGTVLESRTVPNDSALTDRPVWERCQDPKRIFEIASGLAARLLDHHPGTAAIGLTGQQHGIVYLDEDGEPLSPLYTWQDGRGNLEHTPGETWTDYLSRITDCGNLSSGYGLVTHFYNLRHDLVPKTAAKLCTIHDYVAMKLAGNRSPVTDASDAASFGLFDVEKGDYEYSAIRAAGISESILPALAKTPVIGRDAKGRPVCAAIGDNQASFLGTVGRMPGVMLVNIGTGGQFSVHTERYLDCPGLETRPYPLGGYLLVGASLCGGRSYALLERFFREVMQMNGSAPEQCYDKMAALLRDHPRPDDLPKVAPLFQGTRQDPKLRASITGLSTDNFTPLHLIWGMMDGMAEELHQMYLRYLDAGGTTGMLFGSGNGLRKNPYLQQAFETKFELPMTLPDTCEEAACGAAAYAAAALASED